MSRGTRDRLKVEPVRSLYPGVQEIHEADAEGCHVAAGQPPRDPEEGVGSRADGDALDNEEGRDTWSDVVDREQQCQDRAEMDGEVVAGAVHEEIG